MTQRSFANICALHMHHACPFGLPALGRYNKDIFIRLVARPGLFIYSRGGCFLPFSSGKGQHTHTQTTANNALTSVITVQGGAVESFFHTTMSAFVIVHFLIFIKSIQNGYEAHVSCISVTFHTMNLVWDWYGLLCSSIVIWFSTVQRWPNDFWLQAVSAEILLGCPACKF